MNVDTLIKYTINHLENSQDEEPYKVEDTDDLHDILCGVPIENETIETNDTLYNEMCEIIKDDNNVDKILGAIDDLYDDWGYDPFREFCDADFYGV